MASAAARAQGLPLWALPLALLQNQTPMRFLDGTESSAKLHAGCEPVRSGSRALPLPTCRELSPPIPRRSASRPVTGSDAAGRDIGSRPAAEYPAVIPANPTMSATPTTGCAIAADFAIRSPHRYARTGRQSIAPSLPESNAGRALQRLLLPHTTAMGAANPANGSSCGRNPGTRTAAPR